MLERLAVYQDLPHDKWPERKTAPLVEVLVDPGVLTWRAALKRSTFVGRARPPREDGDAVPAGGESLDPDPEDVTASGAGPDLPPPGAGDHESPPFRVDAGNVDEKQPAPTKVCSSCGLPKPVTEFGRHPHSKDKLQGQCRSCKRLEGAAAHRPRPTFDETVARLLAEREAQLKGREDLGTPPSPPGVADPVAQVLIPEVPASAAVHEDVFVAQLQLRVAAWQTEWEEMSAEAEELNEVLNAGYRLLDALGAEPLLTEKT